jgi:hypothetical protein
MKSESGISIHLDSLGDTLAQRTATDPYVIHRGEKRQTTSEDGLAIGRDIALEVVRGEIGLKGTKMN